MKLIAVTESKYKGPPKCMYCGRFIADKDFTEGKAKSSYEVDSEYTHEQTDYYHISCTKNK